MNALTKPPNAWRALVRVLLRIPLFAVPFALFFDLLNGARLRELVAFYEVSLVFSAVITLSLWAAEWFVQPHLLRPARDGRVPLIHTIAFYGTFAVVGSFGGAVVIHFTLVRGFLGSASQLIVFAVFTLLFCALFMGISLATRFYRDSIEKTRSETELDQARRIQRSFLLTQFPELPRLEVHALNLSSRQVSGDFYDVVPAGENVFLLAIADVAGKGVPAALLSSMLQASLRTQAHTIPSVSEIMRNINAMVYRSTSVQQFATFFLARIDERGLRLQFTNAGHNFPVVFRRGGGRVMLERGGTVVGILEHAEYEEDSLELRAGDRVVLYTDGVSEAANASGDLFGEDRLYALVESLPEHLTSREVVDRILEGVRSFLAGVEPGDDITVMVLRVLEAPQA